MTHDLYKIGDKDAPDIIKDRNGEVVLGLCRRCGRAEIELSEPCDVPHPGSQVVSFGTVSFASDGNEI